MKLKIDKQLSGGEYTVFIQTSSFTEEEKEKIKKFGSPSVSLSPEYVIGKGEDGRYAPLYNLPIHAFNHTLKFKSETEAEHFAKQITSRIKDAITTLRDKSDDFSGENEYEL